MLKLLILLPNRHVCYKTLTLFFQIILIPPYTAIFAVKNISISHLEKENKRKTFCKQIIY